MTATKTTTTRLSSKGQVVLPKEIRDRHGWEAGLEMIVEDLGWPRPQRRFPRSYRFFSSSELTSVFDRATLR